MNHEVIRRVIADMRGLMQRVEITERDYQLENAANYILVGVRRAGKSTLLYRRAREFVRDGADWSQIIPVNFEDDRLMEFTKDDFDDIIETAHELTDKQPYFFFDEIQNVSGWERFARRLADYHQRVSITGSNATMLSAQMEAALGGRYISQTIMPFSLGEILDYRAIPHDALALDATETNGRIRGCAKDYLLNGGLPESLDYSEKRVYIQSVYDKVMLGDIVARNRIQNPLALRLLLKKIAETVMHEASYNRLAGNVKATGVKFSTDTAMTYAEYAKDAFLLFTTSNYVSKFSEREGTPRFYFMDNGFLSLFLVDKEPALLENAVAVWLHRLHGDNVYYYKSAQTGIDVDFYVPNTQTAIQVTYTMKGDNAKREVSSLTALAAKFGEARRFVIVTLEEEDTLRVETSVDTRAGTARGKTVDIEVVPLYKFLLGAW